MRSAILTAAMLAAGFELGCSPLRQPLGSVAPATLLGTGASSGSSGTSGANGSTGSSGATGTAGGPTTGTLTGNQIPPLKPEWSACDPMAFRCFQDPGLSPSSPVSGQFSGTSNPDPTAKPVIIYPLAGSVHPINLADITFQWRRGPAAAQTLFRIRLQRADGDVFEFFVPCHASTMGASTTTQCVYAMPPGAWIDAATTARGEAVTVDIAGVDPTHPGVVATSDPMTISFSPRDVTGGLYYWSSSITGTERLLFGARAADAFITPKSASNPATCGGCHAVSGDGSTIAFDQGDTGTAVLRIASTADADTPLFTPATMHDSGTPALNHDGTRVLVAFSGRLLLRDAHTGKQLFEVNETQLGITQHAFHPEWSPDDATIAVTLSAEGDSDWAVRTGAIATLPYNGGQFGPVQILVPTGAEFNFYPTWSPDGRYIAFATAPVGAATQMPPVTSYDQPNARLRLVEVATKTVTELANATWKAASTSTWPKFAPAAQGNLMFLTFNSKIDYGFFLPNNAASVAQPQLWITAIDASKVSEAGVDPSSPPVWLPFQDVTKRNYLGAWTASVGCRVEGGQSIGCGASQICDAGACAMVAP